MAQSETSPQLVYFDLFSLKTQPEDWSRRMFAQVFDAAQGGDMELYTYSSATSVRVALLASGFYVAKGRGTGDKPETTVGLTPCARVRVGDRLALLGSDWLGRWERSRSRYPEDLAVLDQAGFDRQMLAHPQFCDPLVQI